MAHKVSLAVTALIVLFVSCGIGQAFTTASMLAAAPAAVTRVTFWGNSFPYGYSWSRQRACTRYETVETGRGPVTQRFWVCGQRREVVMSYKG